MSKRLRDRTNQRGTALVIALLVMVTATVIALAANFTSTTEVAISGNQRSYTEEFFTADGGLELIKSYFLKEFCFPSDVGDKSIVGTDPDLPEEAEGIFDDRGLDTGATKVTKIQEGNPPPGRGISAQYFRGNYFRSRAVTKENQTSLEEEFCLISPK